MYIYVCICLPALFTSKENPPLRRGGGDRATAGGDGCPLFCLSSVSLSRARTLAFLNLNLGMRVYRPPSPNLHV